MSEGKSYGDREECSKVLARIFIIFKGFGAKELNKINAMINQLMLNWKCQTLADFSQAVFY